MAYSHNKDKDQVDAHQNSEHNTNDRLHQRRKVLDHIKMALNFSAQDTTLLGTQVGNEHSYFSAEKLWLNSVYESCVGKGSVPVEHSPTEEDRCNMEQPLMCATSLEEEPFLDRHLEQGKKEVMIRSEIEKQISNRRIILPPAQIQQLPVIPSRALQLEADAISKKERDHQIQQTANRKRGYPEAESSTSNVLMGQLSSKIRATEEMLNVQRRSQVQTTKVNEPITQPPRTSQLKHTTFVTPRSRKREQTVAVGDEQILDELTIHSPRKRMRTFETDEISNANDERFDVEVTATSSDKQRNVCSSPESRINGMPSYQSMDPVFQEVTLLSDLNELASTSLGDDEEDETTKYFVSDSGAMEPDLEDIKYTIEILDEEDVQTFIELPDGEDVKDLVEKVDGEDIKDLKTSRVEDVKDLVVTSNGDDVKELIKALDEEDVKEVIEISDGEDDGDLIDKPDGEDVKDLLEKSDDEDVKDLKTTDEEDVEDLFETPDGEDVKDLVKVLNEEDLKDVIEISDGEDEGGDLIPKSDGEDVKDLKTSSAEDVKDFIKISDEEEGKDLIEILQGEDDKKLIKATGMEDVDDPVKKSEGEDAEDLMEILEADDAKEIIEILDEEDQEKQDGEDDQEKKNGEDVKDLIKTFNAEEVKEDIKTSHVEEDKDIVQKLDVKDDKELIEILDDEDDKDLIEKSEEDVAKDLIKPSDEKNHKDFLEKSNLEDLKNLMNKSDVEEVDDDVQVLDSKDDKELIEILDDEDDEDLMESPDAKDVKDLIKKSDGNDVKTFTKTLGGADAEDVIEISDGEDDKDLIEVSNVKDVKDLMKTPDGDDLKDVTETSNEEDGKDLFNTCDEEDIKNIIATSDGYALTSEYHIKQDELGWTWDCDANIGSEVAEDLMLKLGNCLDETGRLSDASGLVLSDAREKEALEIMLKALKEVNLDACLKLMEKHDVKYSWGFLGYKVTKRVVVDPKTSQKYLKMRYEAKERLLVPPTVGGMSEKEDLIVRNHHLKNIKVFPSLTVSNQTLATLESSTKASEDESLKEVEKTSKEKEMNPNLARYENLVNKAATNYLSGRKQNELKKHVLDSEKTPSVVETLKNSSTTRAAQIGENCDKNITKRAKPTVQAPEDVAEPQSTPPQATEDLNLTTVEESLFESFYEALLNNDAELKSYKSLHVKDASLGLASKAEPSPTLPADDSFVKSTTQSCASAILNTEMGDGNEPELKSQETTVNPEVELNFPGISDRKSLEDEDGLTETSFLTDANDSTNEDDSTTNNAAKGGEITVNSDVEPNLLSISDRKSPEVEDGLTETSFLTDTNDSTNEDDSTTNNAAKGGEISINSDVEPNLLSISDRKSPEVEDGLTETTFLTDTNDSTNEDNSTTNNAAIGGETTVNSDVEPNEDSISDRKSPEVEDGLDAIPFTEFTSPYTIEDSSTSNKCLNSGETTPDPDVEANSPSTSGGKPLDLDYRRARTTRYFFSETHISSATETTRNGGPTKVVVEPIFPYVSDVKFNSPELDADHLDEFIPTSDFPADLDLELLAKAAKECISDHWSSLNISASEIDEGIMRFDSSDTITDVVQGLEALLDDDFEANRPYTSLSERICGEADYPIGETPNEREVEVFPKPEAMEVKSKVSATASTSNHSSTNKDKKLSSRITKKAASSRPPRRKRKKPKKSTPPPIKSDGREISGASPAKVSRFGNPFRSSSLNSKRVGKSGQKLIIVHSNVVVKVADALGPGAPETNNVLSSKSGSLTNVDPGKSKNLEKSRLSQRSADGGQKAARSEPRTEPEPELPSRTLKFHDAELAFAQTAKLSQRKRSLKRINKQPTKNKSTIKPYMGVAEAIACVSAEVPSDSDLDFGDDDDDVQLNPSSSTSSISTNKEVDSSSASSKLKDDYEFQSGFFLTEDNHLFAALPLEAQSTDSVEKHVFRYDPNLNYDVLLNPQPAVDERKNRRNQPKLVLKPNILVSKLNCTTSKTPSNPSNKQGELDETDTSRMNVSDDTILTQTDSLETTQKNTNKCRTCTKASELQIFISKSHKCPEPDEFTSLKTDDLYSIYRKPTKAYSCIKCGFSTLDLYTFDLHSRLYHGANKQSKA